MEFKKEYDLEKLLDYGFFKIDKKKAEEDKEYYLSDNDYAFIIGHARRGQFYYLLVSEKDRKMAIYASEPDGSGCSVDAPDILIKMCNDGIFKK